MSYGPFGDDYDPSLLKVAAELRDRFFPDPGFVPGLIVDHRDGYRVRIESGQYLGHTGPVSGISNFWTWHKVDEEDNKIGDPVSGYGTELISPKTAQIIKFPGRSAPG